MERIVKVGIFDSGIGGLTVLHECVRRAPQFTYYYYGDNSNAPYGSKSKEEITSYVRKALCLFRDLGVDAAVLACNTATAVCAEEMRRAFRFPVVGMEPAVKPAGERCARALILATPRTIESGRLRALIDSCPQCEFAAYPLKGLAGAVEAQFTRGIRLTLADHLPRGEFDGVVLGCTHYVYLKREISEFYHGVPVFDGNAGTANRLISLLKMQGFETLDHQKPHSNDSDLRENRVIFVGNEGKINENLYKSEQMFRIT